MEKVNRKLFMKEFMCPLKMLDLILLFLLKKKNIFEADEMGQWS